MTLTTGRLTPPIAHPQILPQREARRQVHPDLIGISCLAVGAAVAGAFLPALGLGAILSAATGRADALPAILSLGLTFLPISAPVSAIWLSAAIATRRSILRLGGINEGDRAAIAELGRLLARE